MHEQHKQTYKDIDKKKSEVTMALTIPEEVRKKIRKNSDAGKILFRKFGK